MSNKNEPYIYWDVKFNFLKVEDGLAFSAISFSFAHYRYHAQNLYNVNKLLSKIGIPLMAAGSFQEAQNLSHKWWILFAMSATLALSFIDMTAVAISLPQIQKLFHTSGLMLQWVVNAYLLTFTVFVIAGGYFGDTYGPKKIYLIG